MSGIISQSRWHECPLCFEKSLDLEKHLQSCTAAKTRFLKSAVEYLEAIEVGSDLYAFVQGIDRRWWVATGGVLALWRAQWGPQEASYAPTRDAKLFPLWWSPRNPYGYRLRKRSDIAVSEEIRSSGTFELVLPECRDQYESVTVDLETGEIVVA